MKVLEITQIQTLEQPESKFSYHFPLDILVHAGLNLVPVVAHGIDLNRNGTKLFIGG
jgi:hypothetical protein